MTNNNKTENRKKISNLNMKPIYLIWNSIVKISTLKGNKTIALKHYEFCCKGEHYFIISKKKIAFGILLS